MQFQGSAVNRPVKVLLVIYFDFCFLDEKKPTTEWKIDRIKATPRPLKETRLKKKYQCCTEWETPGIFSKLLSLKCINISFPWFCIKSRVSSLKQIFYLNSHKNVNGKYVDLVSEKQRTTQLNGKIIRNGTIKLQNVISMWITTHCEAYYRVRNLARCRKPDRNQTQ